MSAPEYKISTLADFLSVPADRQAACLADFAAWLDMARKSDVLGRVFSSALGVPATFSETGFTWVDDGVVGVSALDIGTEQELIARIALHGSLQ